MSSASNVEDKTSSTTDRRPLAPIFSTPTPLIYNRLSSASKTSVSLQNVSSDAEMRSLPSANRNVSGTTYKVEQDLISMSPRNSASVLDIFDPLTQSSPASLLSPLTWAWFSSCSFPWPIRLRLKLTTTPELRPFNELVEQIRDERPDRESSADEIFYCKHIQHITSQHIEQTQPVATVCIVYDPTKEPARLLKVSLRSTAAQILKQLREGVFFDLDEAILKLPLYDEYLRDEDVLAEIEHVYDCLRSLKPIQFVLATKPVRIPRDRALPVERISFEQFCFKHRRKYIPPVRPVRSLKSLAKTKQPTSPQPPRHLDSQWLQEFRERLTDKLKQIETHFNSLIHPAAPTLPVGEQIKSIQDFLTQLKTLPILCSDVQSPAFVDALRQLRSYSAELAEVPSIANTHHARLTSLLLNVLLALINYIQAYTQALYIPYAVKVTTNDSRPVDVEQAIHSLTVSSDIPPLPIIESSDLFTVHIDSLYSLPSSISTVRVLARLCYGNGTQAKQLTRLMSFVRHAAQESFSHVHFEQRLSFNGAYLCRLQRETVLLFEIYATFVDEADPPASTSVTEVFDGIPMRLIGWCSQAIFDHDYRLITGERYLGVVDSSTASRAGFYSLRNVSDRDCAILSVDFGNLAFFWPDVPARTNMTARQFTELSPERQEYLSQLLRHQSSLLNDRSHIGENRKQSTATSVLDEANEFSEDERHLLWSHRQCIVEKPYTLPKLLESRTLWDYPSLIDIYGLLSTVAHHRTLDDVESFELLLPAFPDTHVRSFAYRSLVAQISDRDLLTYLPQLLQMIKLDYNHASSSIVEFLLRRCQKDRQLAHKLYWDLRQLFLTETVHFTRYLYTFLGLLYAMDEAFSLQLEQEYELCVQLKRIGMEIKTNKTQRGNYLIEQLKAFNKDFFQSGQTSCRLPCRFSFTTNNIDPTGCMIFSSFTLPIKLVFNSSYLSMERYQALYKIGDDLRQDQCVLQLLTCMDKIWKANDFDFRLSLFNVVQTQERCGFVEMITESETLLEIEKFQGTIKGSFGESALYDWLSKHNATERDLRMAIDNLVHSCAGYCVATYILGIGDRHNENIMVKRSGHLFHIDFGKYLGDTQKFGSFNRDRAPFVFTKQMLYAMSVGGTSNDAMHQFVDLCCSAFITLRKNSSFLLLLLSHLCSAHVPNLNVDAVRFVYERLAPSKNYAESVTHFTSLIIESLQSTWTLLHGFIHKMAQPSGAGSAVASGTMLSFVPSTYTIVHEGKVKFARVVDAEKRIQSPKRHLYKLQVERTETTYHYRTYKEFLEFYGRLREQFPSIAFDFKPSPPSEEKSIALKRVNDFLEYLFSFGSEITESDIVCTFFHTIPRDQQINDVIDRYNDDHCLQEPDSGVPSRIGIELKYEGGKLFVMIRYASNLPLVNGNEPRPYCKCYLYPDDYKVTKRKGNIMNSRNPIFNETFTYEMDLAELQKRTLRVSIWNYVWNVNNHLLNEADIVLADADWSAQKTSYYALTSPNS